MVYMFFCRVLTLKTGSCGNLDSLLSLIGLKLFDKKFSKTLDMIGNKDVDRSDEISYGVLGGFLIIITLVPFHSLASLYT